MIFGIFGTFGIEIYFAKKNMPDVALLFAWNHKTEIFKKEKEFSNIGEWIAHIDI